MHACGWLPRRSALTPLRPWRCLPCCRGKQGAWGPPARGPCRGRRRRPGQACLGRRRRGPACPGRRRRAPACPRPLEGWGPCSAPHRPALRGAWRIVSSWRIMSAWRVREGRLPLLVGVAGIAGQAPSCCRPPCVSVCSDGLAGCSFPAHLCQCPPSLPTTPRPAPLCRPGPRRARPAAAAPALRGAAAGAGARDVHAAGGGRAPGPARPLGCAGGGAGGPQRRRVF